MKYTPTSGHHEKNKPTNHEHRKRTPGQKHR